MRMKRASISPWWTNAVPDAGGVDHKLLHFGVFLRRAFDRLDAVQRFGQVGVHLPKGAAHIVGNGREVLQIAPERGNTG